MKKFSYWWVYAIGTTFLWGFWGALIEIPEKNGFPATLGYCVWALVMIIPAYFALRNIDFKLDKDKRSIWHGTLIGVLGAGGHWTRFHPWGLGLASPVFRLFPFSHLLTILFPLVFLKEKPSK